MFNLSRGDDASNDFRGAFLKVKYTKTYIILSNVLVEMCSNVNTFVKDFVSSDNGLSDDNTAVYLHCELDLHRTDNILLNACVGVILVDESTFFETKYTIHSAQLY